MGTDEKSLSFRADKSMRALALNLLRLCGMMEQTQITTKSGTTGTAKTMYAERRSSHGNCIACGKANPFSLGLSFDLLPDGSVQSRFKGNAIYQGYKGILHGGIVSTLLDASMAHCLFHHGIEAVTGDLQVRFLKPVLFDAELTLTAKITQSHPLLYKLESEVSWGKQLMAAGKGKFMKIQEL